MGELIDQVLSLCGSCFGQPTSSSSSSPQGELSSPALPWLAYQMSQGTRGRASSSFITPSSWLSHTCKSRASPTVLPRQDAGTNTSTAIEEQGQLSQSQDPWGWFPCLPRVMMGNEQWDFLISYILNSKFGHSLVVLVKI